MANIIDYIDWRGDVPFSVSKFNTIDAIIFCELSYFPMEDIVPADFSESISIRTMCEKVIKKNLSMHDPLDIPLAKSILNSTRYDNVKLCGFINDVNVEQEHQFSAIVFVLDDGDVYVAFRGTDRNLIGWKENMDLAYHDEVPAQSFALGYLTTVLKFFQTNAIVGGHSKGGNLAVYASAFCDATLFDKIKQVYNFDGPGFNHVVIQNPAFDIVKDKVKTIVPHSSIIGMLLEHKEKINVIQSTENNGFAQHSLFTWEIKRNELEYLEGITPAGQYTNENVRDWISRMSFEEKEQFIDTVFKLVDKNKTVEDVFTMKNIIPLIKSYRDMDEADKQSIKLALGSLKDAVLDNIKEKIDYEKPEK